MATQWTSTGGPQLTPGYLRVLSDALSHGFMRGPLSHGINGPLSHGFMSSCSASSQGVNPQAFVEPLTSLLTYFLQTLLTCFLLTDLTYLLLTYSLIYFLTGVLPY